MKTLVSVSCLLAAASGGLAGCASQQEELPKEVLTQLETAFNKEDVKSCVDVFTDDAEIIAEDAPVVRGKQAITHFFEDQVARDISFDTDTTVNIVSGDIAVEQGTYRVRNVNVGQVVEYGEFLNIWRRVGGQWKSYRTMYNVTEAPRTDISVEPAEEGKSPPT